MRKGQKIKLLTNVGKLKKNEIVTVTGVDYALRMAFIKNDKGISESVDNNFSNYQLMNDSKELKFKEGSLKIGQTFKTGGEKGKILKLQWDPKFGYDVLYYSEKSGQNVWTQAESNFTLDSKENVIETYTRGDSKYKIIKASNGKYFNVYGDYKGAAHAGPYNNLDEAREMLQKHRPKSIKDSKERLKTYNIKNHNTGKTYRVKAKSFKDAKDKYEKYIKDGNSFTYKGYVIIKSSYGWKVKIGNKIIEFATDKEAKEYIDLHKDTFSEDANWDTLLANLGFAHNQGTGDIQIWKYRDKDRDKFEKAIEHIRRVDRKLILSASSQSSGEHKITIMKPAKDSWTEDATLTYIENYKRVKIYQNDDNKKYTAEVYTKSYEDKDLKKLKVKIDEALNEHIKKYRNLDSWTEDANIKYYAQEVKSWSREDFIDERDELLRMLDKAETQAQKEGHRNFEKRINNIQVKLDEVRYIIKNRLFSKDSFSEDATLAQLEIKNTFLEEDDDANEVKYLGFNDDRKISFYEYGDKYFAFFDLENRVEVIEKDEVQRILKKNLIKETDQDKDELFREGDEGIATTVRSENEGGSK